ncbi:hypothetical protein D9757_014049 [Collybiopsis confluens]|uniref:C2H2-type domain-containing protein n=1 Tax=Collybiopsis confluens TaxID=2823264 RepID=A0A8H5CQN0_9AGAR|nr:hypothetical protein D9757_014049 [Collybiopsis confluens]
MDIPCPVCPKLFSRVQDRDAHLNLKQDSDHVAYIQQQNQRIETRFNRTVKAATSVRPDTFPQIDKPILQQESGKQQNSESPMEVDSSSDMDVDLVWGEDSEEEEGEVIGVEDVVGAHDPDELEERQYEERMREEARKLCGVELEDVLEHLNFLPDQPTKEDVPTGNESPSFERHSSSFSDTLPFAVEDEATWTWKWHPSAGKVYGTEPNVYARWAQLFLEQEEGADKGYYPFTSRLEWEIAQWAVQEKITQQSFDRLLRIPKVKDSLGVTFSSARAMLAKVDEIPSRGGSWYTKQLSFKDHPDETFTIRHRNPLDAIKALWGDPSFANDLVYRPAKLFRNSSCTENERVFSEMWTGSFWNAVQELIPEGGTIAPVILASDKTQLTQFSGSKSAYPVYMTLGNIPKSLRRKPGARACILIAYLSVDKLPKKLSQTILKLRNYELFHRSMAIVLEPLKAAGDPSGPGVEMVGGDGAVRRVYPLLATYVADYPEQCLVTCTKYGTCPKCRRKAGDLQLPKVGESRTQSWTYQTIKNARQDVGPRGGVAAVHALAMESDVAGGIFEPFWVGFPLTDIHRCVAPDILHQIYQGVFKHLVSWIQQTMGKPELDARIQRLPPTSGVRHFSKGISVLAQVSGTERKHMARILVACLLAQYPSHTQYTLGCLQTELDTWHKYRNFFIHASVREHFNIPKFHSLLHYIESIRWLGTTDNYNTEAFERLHIDFAKEGWRASNKRDPFPQMVRFMDRQEKIFSYDFYRSWTKNNPSRKLSSGGDLQVGAVEADKEDRNVEKDEGDGDEDEDENEEDKDKEDKDENKEDKDKEDKEDKDKEDKEDEDEDKLIKKKMADNPRAKREKEAEKRKEEEKKRKGAVIKIAKHPQESRKKLSHILVSHRAPGFGWALKLFLHSLLPRDGTRSTKATILRSLFPFTALDVWHRVKLMPTAVQGEADQTILRALPITSRSQRARFDTVLVSRVGYQAKPAVVRGCRVARLRVIFKLPLTITGRTGFEEPAPSFWPKEPLAYVTWYTHFKQTADKHTGNSSGGNNSSE